MNATIIKNLEAILENPEIKLNEGQIDSILRTLTILKQGK